MATLAGRREKKDEAVDALQQAKVVPALKNK